MLRFTIDVVELPPVTPELSRGAGRRVERHPNRAVGTLGGGFGAGTEMPLSLQLCNCGVVNGGSELGPHPSVHHSWVHTVHVHCGALRGPGGYSLCQQARVGIAEDFGEAVGIAIASCRALIASLAHFLVSIGQTVDHLLVECSGVDQLVSQALVGNILHIKPRQGRLSSGEEAPPSGSWFRGSWCQWPPLHARTHYPDAALQHC